MTHQIPPAPPIPDFTAGDDVDAEQGFWVPPVAVDGPSVSSTSFADGPQFLVPREIKVSDAELANRLPVAMYGVVALDIAMGILTPEQMATIYNVDVMTFAALAERDTFKAELAQAKKTVEKLSNAPDGGVQLRARVFAEAGMSDIYALMRNPDTAPNIRLGIWRHMMDLAGLGDKGKEGGGGTTVNITIAEGIRGLTDGSITIDAERVKE